MYRNLLTPAVLLAFMAVLQIGCGSDDNGNGSGPTPVGPPRLLVSAHQNPTLDGAINSQVWDSVEAVTVKVGSNMEYIAGMPVSTPAEVFMKAITADDSLIYILAQWTDNSEDNRFGQLHATYVSPGSLPDWDTDTSLYNEDRFYIMFDNGASNGANCAAYCHETANSIGRKFYGNPGDDVDIWQWKAHRTGLAKFVEDMHLSDTMITPDPLTNPPGVLLYYHNFGVFEPSKMHPDGPAYEGPGLLEGVWVDFDGDLEWVVDPPDGPPYGKDVPGYYFYNLIMESRTDRGSRWDTRSVSNYDDVAKTWTVVFRRALTTGNSEDIDFSAITDSIAVTIGVTNNSGVDHVGREPFYMILQ